MIRFLLSGSKGERDMKLCKLRGNLCVGGMSLKDIDVFIDEELIGLPANWSGELRVDRSEVHCLQLERRYLLMLDEDTMGCVKLVLFRPDSDASSVLAEFVPCNHQ
jgi:hypothetical protein